MSEFDNLDKVSLEEMDGNPIKNSIEFHRTETDSDNDRYELILRGYKKEPGTNNWNKEFGSPNRYGMTDKCVSEIMAKRNSIITKNTLQASFTGKMKLKMYDDTISYFMDAFDSELMINGEEWGLSVSASNDISREMEEYHRLVLTRPIDNKERDRDKANENFHHNNDMNVDSKSFN